MDKTMEGFTLSRPRQCPKDGAIRNERFVGKCLKKIHAAPDAEEGLRCLLEFLGKSLECDRVYVFEEMDRQHIRNTYEWCREGVPSGIVQLPYVAKKDLVSWYGQLAGGGNIIEPAVENLRLGNPLVYGFLKPQEIRSVILSPLLVQGRMVGFLGADNPPPGNMEHISVLFDVLSYFVTSLINQRELEKLRETRTSRPQSRAGTPRHTGKTVLLVDDSRELLHINKRVLRPEGYDILCAGTLKEAGERIMENTPDAIVMDIDLPDGNGLAFCRDLQKQANIPVVFLTARSDVRSMGGWEQAGGYAFLTKPYQLEELLTAVAGAVDKGTDGGGRD